MPDAVLTRDGPVAVPMDYPVPSQGELLPLTVRATIDGSSAAQAFYAVVQVIAPSGRIMGSYITAQIAAGGSADATWFPWWRGVTSSPSPSPNPLGTLFAWYDFADTSTITLDGSGNIQLILDKTGNGHDASQPTAGKRPGETTVNGHNAGLFASASATSLVANPFSVAQPQPITVAAVFTQTRGPGSSYFPGFIGGISGQHYCLMFIGGVSGHLAAQMETLSGPTALLSTPCTQQQATAIYNGASSALRLNGTQTSGTMATTSVNSIRLGSQTEPNIPGEEDHMDGALCEALYYTGSLSASQLSAVESYLKSKWGTP